MVFGLAGCRRLDVHCLDSQSLCHQSRQISGSDETRQLSTGKQINRGQYTPRSLPSINVLLTT